MIQNKHVRRRREYVSLLSALMLRIMRYPQHRCSFFVSFKCGNWAIGNLSKQKKNSKEIASICLRSKNNRIFIIYDLLQDWQVGRLFYYILL